MLPLSDLQGYEDTLPLSLLCIIMILRVRRKILKLLRSPTPVVPEGYVMDEKTARDFLACNDRSDLKKLLAKLKEKSLNTRMKYDPAFATSPIIE